MDFLTGPHTVRGSFTGQTKEIQDAVNFVFSVIRPMIETFPLERANEACEKGSCLIGYCCLYNNVHREYKE